MKSALYERSSLLVLLLFASFAYSTAVSCPEVIVRQAIVAGQNTVDTELLSFSAVLHDSTGTCTATILNNRYLLTAAHCAYEPGTAVHATTPERKGEPDAKIIRFISHPKYTRNSIFHDVAVVEVDPPLEDVKFVTLHNGAPPKPKSFARAAGYGVNRPSAENDGMGVFRRVDLPIVDMNLCTKALGEANYRPPPQFTSKNYICAGYLGADSCGGDTCSGDSGGPLVVKRDGEKKYVQIGVTSAGATCGGQQVPGIYTSVAGHVQWIASIVSGDIQFTDAFVTESKIDKSRASSESESSTPTPSITPSSLLPSTNPPILTLSTITPSVIPASASVLPTVTPSVAIVASPLPTASSSDLRPTVSALPNRPVPISLSSISPIVSASSPTIISTIQPSANAAVTTASPTASASMFITPVISNSNVANRGKNIERVPVSGSKQNDAKANESGDPNKMRDVQNTKDAMKNTTSLPDENGDAQTGNVTATGDARPRDKPKTSNNGGAGSAGNATGTSSGSGSVLGSNAGSISAIVVSAILGSLALVLGLFFGVRTAIRGREPALEFQETGFDDSLRTAVGASASAAAVNEDAESAAAEADIPNSLESSVDTTPRQNLPQSQPPLSSVNSSNLV